MLGSDEICHRVLNKYNIVWRKATTVPYVERRLDDPEFDLLVVEYKIAMTRKRGVENK